MTLEPMLHRHNPVLKFTPSHFTATHCYDHCLNICLKDDRNCEYGGICLQYLRVGHNLYFNICVIYLFYFLCARRGVRGIGSKLDRDYRSSKQRHILGNTAWTLDQQYHYRMKTDNNTN